MPNLTFTGEYFRYEIQEIDEDDAKEYIENGIDEGDLEDMDFSDEAEQGISGEILLTLDGSQLATLQIKDLKVSSVEPQPDYWHILKLEHGRRGCICGPLEIEGAFDKEAVKFSSYVKKVGEVEYRYASVSYGDESVEQTEERIDEVEYFVVSPKGKMHELEIS
jgi:hypothetical protein